MVIFTGCNICLFGYFVTSSRSRRTKREGIIRETKRKGSGVATGGLGVTIPPPPIEPQMMSYIIKTVRTKCIIDEALKVGGQKYDKLSLKIVQKALKWPLQYATFEKISGGACPCTILESFLALNLLKNNSAGENMFEK